jgi:hypothetical protein
MEPEMKPRVSYVCFVFGTNGTEENVEALGVVKGKVEEGH